MDEVRKLQEQLRALQETSNVKRVTERNCIDLLAKLFETQQVKLFHTSNGREWITPEALDREIVDSLIANGGRLSLTDIPGEVGVAIEHVETRLDHVCKGSISRLHGELVTNEYLQSLVEQIEDSLELFGCLSVSDLAVRFNLPAEFVREKLLTRVDSSHTVLQHEVRTGLHSARVEARLLGCLRGCLRPVQLSAVAQRVGIDEHSLASHVQRLLKDDIRGRLVGPVFTPQVFLDAQTTQFDSFFSSNQYVPLALAQSSGVNIDEWSKTKQIEGVVLSTVFLGGELLDEALSQIGEAVTSGSWINVETVVPTSLVEADVTELLNHLSAKRKLHPRASVLDPVIVSTQCVEGIASGLEAQVKAAAERAMSAPAKSRKKAADEDDDDGGKKKGKKVKSKKGKVDDEDAATTASGIDNQTIIDSSECFAEMPSEVHSELCELVQPLLAEMVAQAQNTLRDSLQSKRKVLFEAAEKVAQEQYERLVFGSRALEVARLQETPLYAYLLRETVPEPLHRLIALLMDEVTGASAEVTPANRKQCLDKIVAKEGVAKAENLTKLLTALGGKAPAKAKGEEEDKGKAKAKVKSSKSKGSKSKQGDEDEEKPSKNRGRRTEESDEEDGQTTGATVPEIFFAAADECHIFCRKVDKKREKAVQTSQKTERKQQLREAETADPPQVFSFGLQCVLAQMGMPGLLFPQEIWAFKLLAACIDEDLRDTADAFCEAFEKGESATMDDAATAWRDLILSKK
mmetsp:Transcript_25748/g.67411  ORF Transcript_25748/g.67411 Transcript_25748/m.67411 type:complete len:745 (-) Transcript_25748:110-2344(-)|eukprot:CAMPEP_0194536146 /NCGR_PEP_ID=MMETSP0253-20130528/74949_1 /TAXON_ID=2966 /ORGANISM="Noctiluca scintillans" /LENGTH=744 /DNA_ID=CAMNT_0039382029 /DNA_START=61 /DNA_END=2295 /DNA_ORIENTATION=-